MQRNLVIIEFFILFVMPPLIVAISAISFYLILMPMFIAFVYALWWLFGFKRRHWENFWRSESSVVEKKQLKVILVRFFICSILLTALVLQFYPDKFLNFPLQHPLLFVLFLVVYPLFSVLPQELLYRTFFFERYQLIFSNPKIMILASTIAFSYLHIMYNNYESVILTLVGGYFFSRSYEVTRSLLLVTFEHSLYGILVFTLGLGGFFMRGLKELGFVL